LDKDVVRDEPLGGDRIPQVWSEIGPERVDAVTAETIDMEPLPALILVRGRQELVGRLRLGDLAATVGTGLRFHLRTGSLPSTGLHGPLARSEGNTVFAEDPLDPPSLPIERLLDPSEERPLRLAH